MPSFSQCTLVWVVFDMKFMALGTAVKISSVMNKIKLYSSLILGGSCKMRINSKDTAAVFIDFQEKLVPVISGKEEIVRKSAILAQGLAEVGVPYVVSQQYTKGLGETIAEVANVMESFQYMEKSSFSCFECEEIAAWIKAQGKKTILICGVEAHICVLQTVIDLLGAEYRVFVVADCVGSRNPYDKEIGLERMKAEGALLTTCEAVLFELAGGAKSPHFKVISKLVK